MRLPLAILCGESFVAAVLLSDALADEAASSEPCDATGDGEDDVPSWYAEEL